MKKIIFFLAAMVLTATSVFAQEVIKVTGTVTDIEGEPIPGVTVLVFGTMTGTQTDSDGTWQLNVGNPSNATIQFICLGFRTVKVGLRGRTTLDVTMTENFEELNAVVKIGYGSQKRENITGSVASLSSSDLGRNRTIITTSSALSGLVPGMFVQQTTALPGQESTSIRIRGTGSFTSSASSPLVLVDGVEWSMDDVNPADIESISVLKDASSTAIYGTRAANGVILITTRTGSEAKPRIRYTFNGIFQTPYNNLQWVSNFADYMEYINEANYNYNQADSFSSTTIATWREKTADPYGTNEYGVPNYIAYPNTDWYKEIFCNAFSQEHQLSISGGGRRTRYVISGSYLDNNGVMTSEFDTKSRKGTFRANLEADVTSWFTVGTKLFGEFYTIGNTDVSRMFVYLSNTSPGIWPGTENKWGRIASNEDGSSAHNLFNTSNNITGTKYTWMMNGTVYATIRPYKGVSIEGTVNYSPTFKQNHTYTKESGVWDYVTNTRYTESNLASATVTDYSYRDFYVNTELLARYNGTFNTIHDLGVLLGYTTNEYVQTAFELTKVGATDWSLNDGSTYSDYSDSDYTARSGWRLRSYFARVNYALKNRYLFEGNIRVDGSSVFGSDNRYGVFPSFSAGWKINDEPWMASAAKWLSQLKLRASWGQTGNNQGIGNYTWQATYTAGGVVVDGSNATALYIASMSNIDLKWETTSSLDIGVDAGFFGDKLSLELDYYYKNTRDILYTPSTYITMGDFTQVPRNLGNMWNQGVELSLNWKDTVGANFYYYAGVNFSYNRNMVTKFKGQLVTGWNEDGYYTNYSDVAESWSSPGVLVEGHAIGEHRIYKLYSGTGAGYSGSGSVDPNAGPKDGMIRTQTDFDWAQAMIDAGYNFNGVKTLAKTQLWYGDFIYADLNGDGNYGNSYDMYFTGHSSVPSYNLGINLGFSWKGLEFSMIWSGAFDYYLNWTTTYYNTSTAQLSYAVSKRIAENHYFYDPDNPADERTNIYGKYPRLTPVVTNNAVSDFNDYKADYMKLKNVTIGYSIPEKWTRKFYVQRLKFYVSGENLLTITSYPGQDPERGTGVGYPLMRQYTLGAQITF